MPVGGQFAASPLAESTLTLDDGDGHGFGGMSGRDRVDAMLDEISTAMETMSNPEGWKNFLDQMSRFHHYSFGNAMLIQFQRPDATLVAGFHDWKNKFGRTVKKGEKAIWILAPMIRKRKDVNEETGEEVDGTYVGGFRSVAVFDVSQTEGDPLPENPAIEKQDLVGAAPHGMVEKLTTLVESKGFSVSYDDTGDRGGFTSFSSNSVVISSTLSEREQAEVLAHETAHIFLDHGAHLDSYHTGVGGSRPDMEIEAESVAYIISKHLGIDDAGGTAFNYIDSWARGDKDRVKKTATAVAAAAKEVLASI